ncbi:MAG: cyclic nucleotide-binding domain-containing protein [Verrucomicrobia bacterium]|nr:cyclic nucleotide-binding domain-containing protein [Verrucomicrobiota bacterium]
MSSATRMDLTSLFRSPEFYVPFRAGQVVFKENDPGDAMYVVIEGEVELTIRGNPIRAFGRGEVVGEMALISDKPRVGTVTARTDCKLAPINKKRFLLLVQQSPQFSLHMLETMAERIRWMDSLITPNTSGQ